MGEIIKFPGSPDNMDDKNRRESGRFDLADTMYKAGDIRKYLNGLDGPISHKSLSAAQDLVSSYSRDQMVVWIMNSAEQDWQSRPAFFSALCDAYYLLVKKE